MRKDDFAKFMDTCIIPPLQSVRNAGHSEYAGGEDAFGNFNRLAVELGIDRKQVLWIYAMKHKDGIVSFLNGHTSQREPIEGRIKDLMMYLALLWGMIEEERNTESR